MRITAVHDTDLFVGSARTPKQVVRVTLSGPRLADTLVRVQGPRVDTPQPVRVPAGPDAVTVEVGVRVDAAEGSTHRATAIAVSAAVGSRMDFDLTVAETGWTMWLVSHFHYDPVWWNTQAGFTDTWLDLPGAQDKRMPFQLSAFDLVRAHLAAAHEDPDYRFVLAEVDYLKPHWDAFPADRRALRALLAQGRVEIVGGNYNEANTNLTHPESTIRNAVHGFGFQRDVLGADPRSAWMLDVFGHDPAYPGLMADAGLDSSAWARGPWHHVGARRHAGDITRMQFPAEFEWLSPSGRGLLTSYMADHYVAGWDIERVDNLEASMAEAYKQFSSLRQVAATRNVLLPVGHDHNVPSRFCTQIHREWNARYVWPRFVVGLPRDYFAAVRADAAARDIAITPQTRDMNPVYTGKDVSYIDTKQAQRAAESVVLDAERTATLAALLGARYPDEALDKAWRQLVYGAHHDAITGTESDQVYLDLLTGWREADELGREVLTGALHALADHANTTGPGVPVLAMNTLSWPRDAITTVTLRSVSGSGVRVVDPSGAPVPAVTEGLVRAEDGSLAEITLSFLAVAVPALGYRVYRVLDADTVPPGWTTAPGEPVIENDAFLVAARGAALSRVFDKRVGREVLRPDGVGAELVLQREHPMHPVWEEGPWHLLPAGPGEVFEPVSVSVQTSPIGNRIVTASRSRELRAIHQVTLYHGIDRVDIRSHVDGSIGQDHLLRLRFDLDVPGALPVAEVGFAAVGRSFGFPDADAAEHLWTLDSPAHTWAGLSAPVRLRLDQGSGIDNHAVGGAEVITDAPGPARELLAALVAKGVTATCTRPDGPRYGSLDADSNLPDLRIVLGADNTFADAVLAPDFRAALAEHGRVFIPARRTRREHWVPDADLRGPRDLPVLIVTDPAALVADLADAEIDVRVPAGLPSTNEPADDYSVAVLNQGTPGFVIDTDGRLHLSLLRACSGWPSGVWIDGERRTVPDGSSFAWQHWSHTFECSLVAGAGDFRAAGFARAGQDVNHPIRAQRVAATPGPLPRELGLLTVSPPSVLLTALKPAGNPLASGAADPVGDALTARIYDTTGIPTTAHLTLHGGLRDAARTDLLEERDAAALPITDNTTTVDLGPADIATLRLSPASTVPGDGRELARRTEPVQPVFTRYWRHNAGPAPLGNLPVSVHITPSRLRLTEGEAEAVVTVSCSGRAARGTVDLVVPPGLRVTAPALGYALAPGEHAEFPITVRGIAPGRYLLGAWIGDDLGQILEDSTEVLVATDVAEDLVEVRLAADAIELSPGESTTIPVELANLAHSEIRGEVTLISPFGTWADSAGEVVVGPRAQPFTIAAGAKATVSLTARASATARPGAHWWALVRVTGHGRLHYSPAVPVRVR